MANAQYTIRTDDPNLDKSINVRACPFCGNDELYISSKPSKDGTITWYTIMHGATTRCSVSMIDADLTELINRWNTRT